MTRGILAEKGITEEQIKATVATGYGRVTYPAEREVSEITCQAKGIAHFFPGARTVIDIGGQDSKVIKVLPGGKVMDFAMNDKCAAGTGRFLEVMAGALEVSLEEVGALAVKALSEQIGYPLLIPDNPQVTAALGAALLAGGMGKM